MNIREFMESKGIKKEELTHNEYYQHVINHLGYEELKKIVLEEFTIEELKQSFSIDQHFNTKTTDIKRWDNISGVIVNNFTNERRVNSWCDIIRLYRKNGINVFSQSDGVSILKNTARMLLLEV